MNNEYLLVYKLLDDIRDAENEFMSATTALLQKAEKLASLQSTVKQITPYAKTQYEPLLNASDYYMGFNVIDRQKKVIDAYQQQVENFVSNLVIGESEKQEFLREFWYIAGYPNRGYDSVENIRKAAQEESTGNKDN